MITLDNLSIHFPLRRARLRRKMLSGRGNSGGEIIYKGKTAFVAALQNLNLEINSGDCIALIGHNGSGKTTLLRTLAGIYEPTYGTCSVQGKIASMFSNTLSLSDMETGLQNIHFSFILHGLDPALYKQQLPEIVSLCGIEEYIELPVSMYSEGMKARLGLAMAIIANPDIMLIDEAMTATDINFVKNVSQKTGLFTDKNKVFIIATHARGLLDIYCNKAILLEHGHLKAFGAYSEICEIYADQQSNK